MRRLVYAVGIVLAIAFTPGVAWAWGDEGHKIIALVAEHYLRPEVREKVDAMLRSDPDSLTRHDIADAATWADKYRDSNKRREHYAQTHLWHFVDIEIDNPDLDDACYGHPRIVGPASNGPAKACIVDKIDQFRAELASPATDSEERVAALKFLLHFVGDLHQPLHAADNHDQGGNAIKVVGPPPGFNGRSNLHSTWDVVLVQRLGRDPRLVAQQLVTRIDAKTADAWSTGTPAQWAREAFQLARDHAYRIAAGQGARFAELNQSYVSDGVSVVQIQLAKAGIRLAALLNGAVR